MKKFKKIFVKFKNNQKKEWYEYVKPLPKKGNNSSEDNEDDPLLDYIQDGIHFKFFYRTVWGSNAFISFEKSQVEWIEIIDETEEEPEKKEKQNEPKDNNDK